MSQVSDDWTRSMDRQIQAHVTKNTALGKLTTALGSAVSPRQRAVSGAVRAGLEGARRVFSFRRSARRR